jgi:tetratricopeptide (TPR) repeat protein
MRRREPSGDITQEGSTNIAHTGVGHINFKVQARDHRYVLEGFPAPVQMKLQEGPISRLLAADMQVVPFDPQRDPELRSLVQWRDGPETLQVMLVSGPGGQGKTRLVGEFAQRCSEAGWVVARARHTNEVKPRTVPVDVNLSSCGQVLVVDYAERWPLNDLLELVADPFVRRETTTRVLLVARPAGWWWESLRGELLGLAPDPDHLRLSALAPGPPDRRTAFEHARDAFAARLGVSETERIEPPASLDDPAFSLALSLHMAALVAVDAHTQGKSAPDDPAKLTSYLVRREYVHWGRMHRSGRIQATVPQMAGVTFTATLTRPMPWTAAEKALAAARLADTAHLAKAVLRDHQACYPSEWRGAGTVLEPLYPDRLGEDFVAVHLTGGPSHDLDLADGSFDGIPACLLHATADHRPPAYASHVITMLVETARRWPHVANGYLYPLLRDRPGLAFAAGGATLATLAESADISLLERLEPGLPADRHVDLDLAVAVIARRLTEHRLATSSDPTARARLNATLAWRLFNAGLYKEAVAASVEIVQSYRRLAEADPAAFAPEFARALYNLSVLLSALNSSEAVAFGWEAAYMYLRLAKADPAGFEAELAVALYFLSVLLADQGQREEALKIAEHGVQVYQRLTGSGRAGLESDFVRALCSVSDMLSGLGRWEEALAATKEAVQVYRTLVETSPAAFEEELATALCDMARILLHLGRGEEALSAAEEAVPIYRRLAEANPAAFGIGLGKALNLLSGLLWDAGRKENAVAVMEETVHVFRQAAAAGPVSGRFLGQAHHALADRLSELGRWEEALAARQQGGQAIMQDDPFVYRRDLAQEDVLALANEAARAYRGLAADNPAAFMPSLAAALSNLSGILSELGRLAEAIDAKQEAVQTYRGLAADNPAAFAPALARTLNEWVGLWKLARQEQALAAIQEKVRLYRELAGANAAMFTPYLPQALRELSGILADLGRPEEAVAATQEAVRFYRGLAADDPATFASDLASALSALSETLSALGRREQAMAVKQEAVQTYRGLAMDRPAFVRVFTEAAADLSGMLSELGRTEEALAAKQAARREAVQIYRGLAADNPAAFAPDLASALSDLSETLSALGRREEALAAGEEAVRTYRELAAANPAVFGPYLADRLRALFGMLLDLGRPEQALTARQEAVQTYRELAAANPAVFAPALTEALSNLPVGLFDAGGREDPCTAAERIFWEGLPLARQNGLAFIVALRDRDDAVGLARLLADVRLPQPQAETVFVAPPVGGSDFFATATSPVGWYEENVPPASAVVYILDHEPGLSRRLEQIAGTFYVGVPELSLGQEYGDSVRVVLRKSLLDFAVVIMRDYSHSKALYGVLFDETDAWRMRNLAANFPMNLEDPNAYGYPEPVPEAFSTVELTVESQQRARLAYRPPERSVPSGTG